MSDTALENYIVKVIPSALAKAYTLKNHYMKTFPNSVVCFGVYNHKILSGVLTFGYSTQTEAKVTRLVGSKLKKNEYLEMQRMNLMDTLGKNSESFVLAKVIGILKSKGVKLIITHAGGCKNDCGIVYQASSWLYFGKEPCNDFFLTEAGEYKNIIAPQRFGRVPKGIKGGQAVGEHLFGSGELIKSFRYFYAYPIQKGLRAYLTKKAQAYPKDSAVFRRDGEWITNGGDQ